MNKLQKIGAGICLGGLAFGFVALWWWALLDMTREVGMACFFTAFMLVGVGWIVATVGDEQNRESK